MSKKSKRETDYRPAGRHSAQTCGNCKSMLDDGHCVKVIGMVKPKYVCDLWEAEKDEA
jgi:hypothetical protein